MKTIVQEHKANFETLRRAFANGDVALMDCVEKSTSEHVAVLCIVVHTEGGEYALIPFAKFFNDNPYDLLIPPKQGSKPC